MSLDPGLGVTMPLFYLGITTGTSLVMQSPFLAQRLDHSRRAVLRIPIMDTRQARA